jgi:seryl-tRNA synthetase
VDVRQAARVSGQKFVYLKNEAALLELALTQWAVARAVAKGFTPVATPDVVHPDIMLGCGYQV